VTFRFRAVGDAEQEQRGECEQCRGHGPRQRQTSQGRDRRQREAADDAEQLRGK
jgi:hypothetical protein